MRSTPNKVHNFGVAAVVGILSAAVALGVAELVAGILSVRSPIVAVGDRFILVVPPPVKDLAIELFGTNDKIALLAGIGLAIAALAVAIGYAARRSFKIAAAGVIVICGAGLLAGIASTDPLLQSIFPSTLGAVAGVASIALFRRVNGVALTGTATEDLEPQENRKFAFDRRSFLFVAGGVTAVAAVTATSGRWLASRASAAAARAGIALPTPKTRLAAIPAGASVNVEGVAPFITPNADFYRIDTALVVPQVQPDTWSLKVRGMVSNELEISYQELLDRSDVVEVDMTMTCVSNTRGGELIGNARWLGVPVRNLLDEAGVDPKTATQLIGRSVDRYTCGFPTSAAFDGRTCLVAFGMNGEPLPLEHGFPARLITAGLYGYVSATKWLSELELNTMEGFDSYWVPRGYAKEAPIKTQARIDAPKSLSRKPAGVVQIAGSAWSQPRGITKVEVQVDDDDWIEARLADAVNDSTWRQWVAEYNATPGLHSVTVRATDGDGVVQTEEESEPLPDGTSGRHRISFTVTA